MLLLLIYWCTFLLSNTSAQLRIYGGHDADIENFPYMLALKEDTNDFLCSAVLLSEEWALTSAQCANTIATNLGRYLMANSSIQDNGIKIPIINITVHPQFDVSSLDNDMALILIDLPSECTICEPAKLSSSVPEAQENVTLAGWGVMSLAGELSTILQVIDLPVVDYDTCSEWYENLNWNVTKNKFCAGIFNGSYVGASILDYGGPAVYKGELVGIISYAYSTTSVNFPYAVISKVANYLEWIGEVTEFW